MDDVKIKIIDSDKLIKVINEGSYDVNLSAVMALGAVMLDTSKQQTGKWIEYEQEFMMDRPFETIKKHIRECSLCRTKIAGFDGIMHYCPNCGAKMEVTE